MTLQYGKNYSGLLVRGCGLSKSLMAECCSGFSTQDGCGDCGDPLVVTFDVFDPNEPAPNCLASSFNLARVAPLSCRYSNYSEIVEGSYTWIINIFFDFELNAFHSPGCSWSVVLYWTRTGDFAGRSMYFYRYRGAACDMGGEYGLHGAVYGCTGNCVVS